MEGGKLRVAPGIILDERDLEESFVRASGPGGQNVNKVSSAVQLRFNTRGFSALYDDVRVRLERLAGKRLTQEGVIVIAAQRFRDQQRNREDAMERLLEMLREAAVRPITRRPTKPTLASKTRRLAAKTRRSGIKSLRNVRSDTED
jgi:ribosome-associated protein